MCDKEKTEHTQWAEQPLKGDDEFNEGLGASTRLIFLRIEQARKIFCHISLSKQMRKKTNNALSQAKSR